MKKVLLSLFFVMGFVLVGMSDNPPPPFNPGDPSPIPVDGGVSALLVLGAGYGLNKVRKMRKAKAEGDSTEEN
jgi:hypothetical protein